MADFTHVFPEWALAWSLRQASTTDATRFWTEALFHPAGAPGEALRLASMFPDVAVIPTLQHECSFPRDGAARYGINDDRYRTTFWGLRPDFVVETEDPSLLVLLDAKGGQVPDRTWRDPKELTYFRFLNECAVQHKAFAYIVPAVHADRCRTCLMEYFRSSASVRTGFLLWEELLPLIYDELVATALDQIIKEMEGLKSLREWRRQAL
jgi:hypothetical protein